MYEYKKRPSKIKKIFVFFLLITVVSVLSIFVYNIYINENITLNNSNNEKFGATRLAQNSNDETEKMKLKEETKEEDISNIIEKTIKCVVGISKLKNNGNSIFLNNSTQELGLGTGMIITDNRIYFNKLTCCWK